MKTILSLLICLTCVSSFESLSQAAECQTVKDARELYGQGREKDAIQVMQCLKMRYPDSSEIRRILSDFLWWTESAEASISEADQALSLMSETHPYPEQKFHLSDRLHRWRLRVDGSELSARTSSGQNYSMEGELRYSSQNHLQFGIFRTSRIYAGDMALSDWRFSFGQVYKISRKFYLETRFEYSPEANISARESFQFTPHWISSDGTDIDLVGKISHYSGQDLVTTIGPGLNRNLLESVQLGIQEYSVYSRHWIFAVQSSLTYVPNYQVRIRAGFAFGNAVEGPGLEGDFSSFFAEVGYRFTPAFELIPNINIYRGSVRTENDYGLGVEFRL
jgi:hypothetical protein